VEFRIEDPRAQGDATASAPLGALEPDRDQIEVFVTTLFRHAGSEGYASVRSFLDNNEVFRISTASLKGGLRHLIEVAVDDARRAANNPKRATLCAPLAVFSSPDGWRARQEDLLKGLALSAEIDERPDEALNRLEEILGPATLVVKSGGQWIDPDDTPRDKLHLHWRLNRPAMGDQLAKLKQARRLATMIVGGDASNIPTVHGLRLPGSWHKKSAPRLCHIATASPDVEIDLDEAFRGLEAAAPKGKKSNGADSSSETEPADWGDHAANIIAGIKLHESLARLAAKYARSGTPIGAGINQARALMEASAARHDRPADWQDRFDDIPRAFNTAYAKYASPPAASDPLQPGAAPDPDPAPDASQAPAPAAAPAPDPADAELERLAKLPPLQYERERKAAAKALGLRAPMLDRMVAAKRDELSLNADAPDGLPGRPIRFEDVELWEEEVDGAGVLTDLSDGIGKYVIMEPCQRDAAALGTVFAHTHDLRDVAPIFFIVSPTKRCGKTRLERVVKRAVPKPLMASSATPAFLARVIENHRPTVLIDEFDAAVKGDQAMAETLRGQLNSSFDRDGAKVGKCVPLPGGGYEEREFSTWAPTWIAGIKKIPETVEDRSIVLHLKRKLPGQKVARLRGRDGGEFDVLKRKIARFVADNEDELREIEPTAPYALDAAGDRAADAWEPLFAIADVAGGDWPRRARAAAVALSCADTTDLNDSDVDVELLSDIAQILAACDAMEPTAEQLKNNKHIAVEALEAFARREEEEPKREEEKSGQTTFGTGEKPYRTVGLGGEQIVNALATLVDRKWPAWDKRKPMRPYQLARLLRAYGALSQSLRAGKVVFRGYPRDRLDDAIERYLTHTLPIPPIFHALHVAALEEAGETEVSGNVTSDRVTPLKKAGNSSNSAARDDVTPEKGGIGGSASDFPMPPPPQSSLSGQERVEAAEYRGCEFHLGDPTGFTWIYALGADATDPDLKLAEEAVNAGRGAVETFLRWRQARTGQAGDERERKGT